MSTTLEGKVLAEGKTKIICQHPDFNNRVVIVSKDDITAGDGVRHDVLPGKAANANLTTCNIFRLIQRSDIVPTHFHAQEDETSFVAIKATMIPIEVVVRRRATGSYIKRNPEVKKGDVLPNLVVEFYHKDDSRHDPLMVYRPEMHEFDLYEAGKPILTETKLDTISALRISRQLDPNVIAMMRVAAVLVFQLLEQAWLKHHTVLVDLKVEFGFDPTGRLMLADVIDNDSWRIWHCGNPSDALDKQVYRELSDDDPQRAEKLVQIAKNYSTVANLTGQF
jgi:phosphoribosylaminoimidazole-succinocarboxamide synthase